MDWIEGIGRALKYIEENLTGEISLDEAAGKAYASSAHFQFVFHVVTGVTVGEYVRNRRMTMAAAELMRPGAKVIDVALRYGYDTPESFSKAFARFHGVPPSRISPANAKVYRQLSINLIIRGGFDMPRNFTEDFKLADLNNLRGNTDAEKYKAITDWALDARRTNPGVFDALTEWILDDSQWTDGLLMENEQILMHGVFARFKAQNADLRKYLSTLTPTGLVNKAIFPALDDFDMQLEGRVDSPDYKDAVAAVFKDFRAMKSREIRSAIAGSKTGPTGTDGVELFGYINSLKNADAQVQWTLFMPDMVKRQQDGFTVESFEYKSMPAMRFVGREGEDMRDDAARAAMFGKLDALTDWKSGFDYDLLLVHHGGGAVDTCPVHCVWGRFMRAGAPVPEGLSYIDFIPEDDKTDGAPYISYFAFSAFAGDSEAMHRQEGYDCDAMYDVTRNIILGQGVNIPYPSKYWTAEVYMEGHLKENRGYLFSALDR